MSTSTTQSKVRELEQKCRAQSEQFDLLSRDLEKFRQHAGHIHLLGSSPPAARKPFPKLMNGLAPPIGRGEQGPTGCCVEHLRRGAGHTADKPQTGVRTLKPVWLRRLHQHGLPARLGCGSVASSFPTAWARRAWSFCPPQGTDEPQWVSALAQVSWVLGAGAM